MGVGHKFRDWFFVWEAFLWLGWQLRKEVSLNRLLETAIMLLHTWRRDHCRCDCCSMILLQQSVNPNNHLFTKLHQIHWVKLVLQKQRKKSFDHTFLLAKKEAKKSCVLSDFFLKDSLVLTIQFATRSIWKSPSQSLSKMVGITTPECTDESKGNEMSSGAGMEVIWWTCECFCRCVIYPIFFDQVIVMWEYKKASAPRYSSSLRLGQWRS